MSYISVKKRNNFMYFTNANDTFLNEKCIVCYSKNSNIKVTCCFQHYCNICIEAWCKIKNTCPHCRSSDFITNCNNLTICKYNKYKIYGKKTDKQPYILLEINENTLNIKVISVSYCNFNVTKQILLRKITGDFSISPVNHLNFVSFFTVTCFKSNQVIHYAISYFSF